MGDGNQYLDIIILGVIAAFIILRLRSVLGRRDSDGDDETKNYRDPFRHEGPDGGHSGSHQSSDANDNVVPLPGSGPRMDDDPYDDRASMGREQAVEEETIDESDPIAVGIRDIRRHDPSFDPRDFTSGARVAFEVVLNAFVAGDQASLKSLLSADVYSNFSQALEDRETAGETLEETLVGISKADITEAGMDGSDAVVTVTFVSEQITCTRDAEGEVIDGDPNGVITVVDIWTFSRDTKSRDPNWFLIGTASPE